MALILIVDDSPTEVHVMKKALEKHGFTTAAAADGGEGVRLAREMHPDLIFMDIVMPGMNGYQATRQLANDPDDHARSRSSWSRPRARRPTEIWGLRQGAVDYIVKPVSPDSSCAKAQAPSPADAASMDSQATDSRARCATGRSSCWWSSSAAAARPPHGQPGGRPRPARVGGRRASGSAASAFLVAREETREVLALPGAADARAGRQALDPRPRQRARPAAADHRPARVPRLRRRRPSAQRRACWSSNHRESARRPGRRRGAGLPPLLRKRVCGRRAADGDALRAISRRAHSGAARRSGRCSACAAAREPAVPAGGGRREAARGTLHR